MYLHPAASRSNDIQAPHGEEIGRRVDDGPGSRKPATFKPTSFTGFLLIAAGILCWLPIIRDRDQHRTLAGIEMTAPNRTVGNPSPSPTRRTARAHRARKQNAAHRTVRRSAERWREPRAR